MATKLDVVNRALQKLGAKRVTSLTEDSKNARAVLTASEPVKLALLRDHVWSCAVKRASLAADATAPDWGRANCFTLPADFVRLAESYPEDNTNVNDWTIEGKKIYTDDSAPLYIRYVYDVTDITQLDFLFVELWASALAYELCEEITQSNTKKQLLEAEVEEILRKAKKANAIERVAQRPPEDPWVTARL